jgi:hypothetical protein
MGERLTRRAWDAWLESESKDEWLHAGPVALIPILLRSVAVYFLPTVRRSPTFPPHFMAETRARVLVLVPAVGAFGLLGHSLKPAWIG